MARAAVRPAAPVRLGRGSELLRLISTEYLASSQVRQAPARRSMYDLYGDPTDISGVRDDARMEMKPTADPREPPVWGGASKRPYTHSLGMEVAHKLPPLAPQLIPMGQGAVG